MSTDLCCVVLLFCRLTGLVLVSPILSLKSLPLQWKALLVASLSAVIYPLLPVPTQGWPTLTALAAAAAWELLVGTWLGFMTGLAAAVALSAGALLDLQMGLSNATLLDPGHGESHPMIASAYQVIFILLLLGADGHLALLAVLMRSFETFPLGQGVAHTLSLLLLNSAFQFFPLVLGLALPLMLALLAIDLILALFSRLMPQLNMMLAGASLKLGLGWLLVVLSLPSTLAGMDRLIKGAFELV